VAETTAFLHVAAAFTTDELQRQRFRRATSERHHPLPAAVQDLPTLAVTQAWRFSPPPHDDDLVLLEFDARAPRLFVAFVDANVGAVADAFFGAGGAVDTIEQLRAATPDARVEPLSLADARVIVEDSVQLGEMMVPPAETETWPALRPFAKTVLRTMPEGGAPQFDEERFEADRSQAVRTILGTRAYAESGLSLEGGSDEVDLLDTLAWLTGFLGHPDPFRWSPIRVEAMLLDLVPRKIHADAAYMRRVPEVLSAMVRAAAEVSGTPASVVEETLEVVDDLLDEYFELVAAPRSPFAGAEALAQFALDAVGGPAREQAVRVRRARLVEVMGSEDALDADAVDPIEDHPPDLAAVPPSGHAEQVEQVRA